MIYLFHLQNDIDFEGRLNIRLEHSLSNTHEAEYTSRGNVTVQGGLPFAYNNPLTLQDKQKLQVRKLSFCNEQMSIGYCFSSY